MRSDAIDIDIDQVKDWPVMKKKRQHIRPYLPWIFIGIVVVAILTPLVSLFGWRPPKEFSIATGREGGAYYAYA